MLIGWASGEAVAVGLAEDVLLGVAVGPLLLPPQAVRLVRRTAPDTVRVKDRKANRVT